MPSPKQRVAIIDIGSNSIKLLVADFHGKQLLETVHFETDDTRIGGYLGMGGNTMTEEAMRGGLMAVEKLLNQVSPFQVNQLAIVATSAVREAENRDIFCDWIQQATGHEVNLLSGHQEAESIARGARCDPALSDLDEFYMFDQGGGSLEIIHWSHTSTDLISLPLGAVRLFKKFQNSDLGPLAQNCQKAIHDEVDQQWDQVDWLQQLGSAPWVGTGGALNLIRLLFAQQQGLTFETVSSRLSYQQLNNFYQEIARLTVAERIKQTHLPASRADILPAGLCAILRLMERAKAPELIHSTYNLRYGYAALLALQTDWTCQCNDKWE